MPLLDMIMSEWINPYNIFFKRTEDGFEVTYYFEEDLSQSQREFIDQLIKDSLNDKQWDPDKMTSFFRGTI